MKWARSRLLNALVGRPWAAAAHLMVAGADSADEDAIRFHHLGFVS